MSIIFDITKRVDRTNGTETDEIQVRLEGSIIELNKNQINLLEEKLSWIIDKLVQTKYQKSKSSQQTSE